jgi:biotin transporter BioY
VGNANGEKKRISTIAAVVITVGLGVVLLYFGISLAAFGFYAFSENELVIGTLALLLAGVMVSIPGAVIVSQVRAYLRRRG